MRTKKNPSEKTPRKSVNERGATAQSPPKRPTKKPTKAQGSTKSSRK